MIVAFVLIIIGILLYFNKYKTYFYIYQLYLLFVFKFALTYIGISAPPAINYTVMILMSFAILPFFKKYASFIFAYLAVFLVYLAFKYLWSGLPFFSSITTYILPFLLTLGALSLYENNKKGRIIKSKLVNHIYVVFILQVVVCWVQYLFPSIGEAMFIESYEWRGITTVVKDFNTQDAIGYLNCGFMISNVTAALFYSFTAALLIMYKSSTSKRITIRLALILLAAVPVCIMTGVRAPLFILLFILLVVVYKYERRYLGPSLLLLVGFYFLITRFMVADDMSGLGRIQDGITTLLSSGDEGVVGGSTFKLSVMLIPYFIQNPIIGISLGDYKTPFGYSIGVNVFSTSDAQLLYTLCEIGIIGLFIYFIPYLKYLKVLSYHKTKTGVYLLFGTVLLLSIVDLGVFLIDIAFVFVIGCLILSESPKEKIIIQNEK